MSPIMSLWCGMLDHNVAFELRVLFFPVFQTCCHRVVMVDDQRLTLTFLLIFKIVLVIMVLK